MCFFLWIQWFYQLLWLLKSLRTAALIVPRSIYLRSCGQKIIIIRWKICSANQLVSNFLGVLFNDYWNAAVLNKAILPRWVSFSQPKVFNFHWLSPHSFYEHKESCSGDSSRPKRKLNPFRVHACINIWPQCIMIYNDNV